LQIIKNDIAMKTATYTITIDRKDIPIFEPIFERLRTRITVTEVVDDVFPELTEEDLAAIAISKEQIRQGMVVDSEYVHREVAEILNITRNESKVGS
jgi:hypothetical protein